MNNKSSSLALVQARKEQLDRKKAQKQTAKVKAESDWAKACRDAFRPLETELREVAAGYPVRLAVFCGVETPVHGFVIDGKRHLFQVLPNGFAFTGFGGRVASTAGLLALTLEYIAVQLSAEQRPVQKP